MASLGTGTIPRRIGGALAAAGAIALVAALVLWIVTSALREIDDLATASSDDVEWSLTQLDVEYLRLRLALSEAQRDPGALDAVRRRFDVFYSRIATFSMGEVYSELRADAAFEGALEEVRAFLEGSIPAIDAGDDALRAATPALAAAAADRAEDVRTLTLSGLATFVDMAETRREQVMETLSRMAALLLVLFAGLALLAFWLLRLNRLSASRARQIELTGTRMRTIVETSLDAILVTDDEGRILESNRAARAIFGYSEAEARGADALSLLFPDEDPERAREGALQFLDSGRRPDPAERQFELMGRSKEGRAFPVELSVDRAKGPDGPVYVSFIRDISRRKLAEEGLTEARDKALAGEKAKAEFLAVMSHEMRTPLNGLLGSIQLMRDTDLSSRQAGLVDTMHGTGNHLLGLINDVLDLSKYEAGKLTAETRVFDPARLLDGVVETTASLAAANGNTLGWSWAGAPVGPLKGDARRLRQVLLNLVGNALKFTRGGSVEIEAEALGADLLEIRVIDSGIGISPEDLGRIFQDFETVDSSYARQAGGTGLGLGIARRLVDIMGGRIGAESEPGEGSLFWVRLPMVAADQAASGTPIAADAPDPGGRPLSILLVEDNEINRFVAREMLQSDGHEVTEAVNGQAGVEWAERRRFDVILMDISMPVMDGQEAARRIRSGGGPCARTPIVAVTAHALPEEVARFREAGMEHSISKPIDRAALSRIMALLGDASPETAPAPASLAALKDGTDPEVLRRLVAKFIGEMDAAVAVFPDEDDMGALAAQAHRQAGSCAVFGLGDLRETLARIETEAKQGTRPDGEIAALADLWTRTRPGLVAELENAAP
ncbi:ATP-binding protein [Roseicyclus sp. F158]|uniref:histidine kinase n=1 Tax=Tropicimonas omnivorans TaxID=3075590 RepID=A0ABU3DGZ2_9RHOB|nr:ATP-binding protein [Roseicyclus sp. F158]MDT0682981.1 ATP-binding protein [Roseicyclus sp. F158]